MQESEFVRKAIRDARIRGLNARMALLMQYDRPEDQETIKQYEAELAELTGQETLSEEPVLENGSEKEEPLDKLIRPTFQQERIVDVSLAPSLDDIIGSDLVDRILQAEPDRLLFDQIGGQMSEVHKSSLSWREVANHSALQPLLDKAKGRPVTPSFLVKVANEERARDYHSITYEEALKRDIEASRLPGIYPFSAMTSEPHRLPNGRLAVAVEYCFRGSKFKDGEANLQSADYYRLIFQLFKIGQEYHKYGFMGLDYGKSPDVRFLTEEHKVTPRRIVTYDFAYFNRIEDAHRDEQIASDFKKVVNIIDWGYKKLFPQEVADFWQEFKAKIDAGDFLSFQQMADYVAEHVLQVVDLNAEYQQILSQCSYP